jgi:hypothetical protein
MPDPALRAIARNVQRAQDRLQLAGEAARFFECDYRPPAERTAVELLTRDAHGGRHWEDLLASLAEAQELLDDLAFTVDAALDPDPEGAP